MKLEDFKQRKSKHGVVYLGDAHDILPLLGRDAANVCVTSPPYNLNKRYSDYGTTTVDPETKKEKKSVGLKMIEKYREWYGDFDEKKDDRAQYDNDDERDYRKDQRRIIKKLVNCCTSSVFYNHKKRMAWHSRTQSKNRPPSLLQHPWDWVRGFEVWCEIIWDRCGIGNPVKNRYHSSYEFVYQIGRPTMFKQKKGEESYKDIWRIPPSRNEGHVCTFPEKLVENCILPTTNEGDIIIDPYLGSGTTAVVAIKHGRKFIGIEIEEKYFDVACDNIKAAEKEAEEQHDRQE